MKDWLAKLGFSDIQRKTVSKDWFGECNVWFARQKFGDKEVVLTFVEGTESNFWQWASNVAYDPLLNEHLGFAEAKVWVDDALDSYLDDGNVDRNNVFLSFSGYSRGGAVIDLLASSSSVAGVNITSTNCVAYGFATPDSIRNKRGGNVTRITHTVLNNDPLDHLLMDWAKNGRTVGYAYNQYAVDEFFGENVLGEGIDGMLGHRPESLVAFIFTREPELEYKQGLFNTWYWDRYHCPVNIGVYHEDELVASVIDNVATSQDPDVFITTNEDGQKDVIYPADGEYRVVALATSNGSMDFTRDEIGKYSSQTSFNELETVDIKRGKSYEIEISGELVEVETPADLKGSGSGGGSFLSQVLSVFLWLTLIGLIAAGVVVLVIYRRKRRKQTTSNYWQPPLG
jgi:hypothetical protein